MRLPGSINWPDAKKIAKGRIPRRATLKAELSDFNLKQPLTAFTKVTPDTKAPKTKKTKKAKAIDPALTERVTHLFDFENVNPKALLAIQHGNVAPGCGEPPFKSRSHAVWFVIMALLRARVPRETIFSILTDPQWKISEHVLENGGAKCAEETIAKCEEKLATEFKTNEEGKILALAHNVKVACTALGVNLSHDIFADRFIIEGLPDFGPELEDPELTRLWVKIEDQFGFRLEWGVFCKFVFDIARNNAFHPVRDLMESFPSDGTGLDTWLIKFCGAEDTELNRAISRLSLMHIAARLFRPGTKVDTMPVLEALQGLGKSSALELLALKKEWFTDEAPIGLDPRTVIEATQGKLIVEVAELEKLKKTDVATLKAFLSRTSDTARAAYGTVPRTVQRQFTLWGTVNPKGGYLLDNTGNRRYWPVAVQRIDLDGLKAAIPALFGEALRRFRAGESLVLDEALWPAAAEVQAEREVQDPIADVLAAHDVLREGEGKVRCCDVHTLLGGVAAHRTQQQSVKVNAAMQALGWTKRRPRINGKPEWCFCKGDEPWELIELQFEKDRPPYLVFPNALKGDPQGDPKHAHLFEQTLEPF
jgi:hypothetical protein